MEIRIAKIDDVVRITEIYNQAIRHGGLTGDLSEVTTESRNDWFQEHCEEGYPVFIAEDNSRVVGYCYLSKYRYGRKAFAKTAELSYYVDSDEHRKGVGSALVQYAENYCKNNEIAVLISIILGNNVSSIKLMEHHGYNRWGTLKKIAKINGIAIDHVYYGKQLEKESS